MILAVLGMTANNNIINYMILAIKEEINIRKKIFKETKM